MSSITIEYKKHNVFDIVEDEQDYLSSAAYPPLRSTITIEDDTINCDTRSLNKTSNS